MDVERHCGSAKQWFVRFGILTAPSGRRDATAQRGEDLPYLMPLRIHPSLQRRIRRLRHLMTDLIRSRRGGMRIIYTSDPSGAASRAGLDL